MFESNQYRNVRKPLLEAETLPAHCYTDVDFFAREVERIFRAGWEFVGRADELPAPGNTLVLDTVVGSTIVVRGKDGELRAFANACRHRGTRLQNCAEQRTSFICPYHAWVYDLDGSLRAAPGMNGVCNFSPDNYSLEPRRLETWGGFVFINHRNNAKPLLDTLGDLPDRMAQYQLNKLRCVRRVQFDVNANWKFIIENALEAYHTGVVHRDTLGAQASEQVHTEGGWDALFVPGGANKSIATMPGETQALPFVDGLNGDSLRGTFFTVIYPCTQIVFSQDCVWWLDIKPVSVARSTVTLGSCFPRSTVDLPDFEGRVEPYYHRWDRATPEDNAISEAQQQGQSAGVSARGRFSEREHCVHKLANWVLDQVLD